jgi:hypothetical protein
MEIQIASNRQDVLFGDDNGNQMFSVIAVTESAGGHRRVFGGFLR